MSRAAYGSSDQELDFLSLRSQLGSLAAVGFLHCFLPNKICCMFYNCLIFSECACRLICLCSLSDSPMH